MNMEHGVQLTMHNVHIGPIDYYCCMSIMSTMSRKSQRVAERGAELALLDACSDYNSNKMPCIYQRAQRALRAHRDWKMKAILHCASVCVCVSG